MKQVTFEDVKKSDEVNTYIKKSDSYLLAMNYTEHSFEHVTLCAEQASKWLKELGYSEREVELAKIAGYMHDIGNIINRNDHGQSGAILANKILERMGMPYDDIADVCAAIGNHDEKVAFPVNAIAAALIIADKTDVRRSRVRQKKGFFDIHGRVNYAVKHAETILNTQEKTITLYIDIDLEICSVVDYFEIFTVRMLLCNKAAEYLGVQFKLCINGACLM